MLLPKYEVKISREDLKIGRNSGSLLGAQSLKGLALVQLSQHSWYLAMMGVLLQGSADSYNTTGYVIYGTRERF